MIRSKETYSVTMARVYADQGYLRKAAQIYRCLLADNPDQQDVRLALAALDAELLRRPVPSRKELGLLFKEWVHLLSDLRRRRRSDQSASPKKMDAKADQDDRHH